MLARIGKPHGIRGEVTVQAHTDEPEWRFAVGAVLDTEAAAGTGVPRALTVRSARLHRGIWLLGFEEIPDRTGAESLRGTRLVLPPGEPSEPAPDKSADDDEGYYEEDLVGLPATDSSGAALGEVVGLEVGAAQDVLRVRLTDGRTAYVPFVAAIVPTVDLDAGVVVIDAPPGLLDLAE